MAINYLLLLVFFIGIYIIVTMMVKSIDEKQLVDTLVEKTAEDPEQRKKYKDIYLQKKSKIMFIRAGITALLTVVGLKLYIDNADSALLKSEKKIGGCGCSDGSNVSGIPSKLGNLPF